MANNRLHPVHRSNLVKNLRITLMPHIRQSEWRAVLKNLRDWHTHCIKNHRYMGLHEDCLARAFVWHDTPEGSNYWSRLDRIARRCPPIPLPF